MSLGYELCLSLAIICYAQFIGETLIDGLCIIIKIFLCKELYIEYVN